MKTDTVVIGGGIIGCSSAYYLTRAGVKVTLIERRGIGEGTSGACDGFVMLQSKHPGLPLRMAMRSAEMYQGLEEELGYETQYRRNGGLVLIENEEMREIVEPVIREQIREGVPVEFLNNAEIRRMEPLISTEVAGAAHCALDGYTSPIHTTRAYAKRFRDLGGEILTDTAVTDIVVRRGEVCGVETSRGTIEAKRVIIAAGVWSPYLGEMAGIRIPVKPRRGHLMVTEAVEHSLHKILLCARYIAIKHDPSLAEKATDPTFHLGVSLSMEQTLNGNFLIGSNREFAGYDLNTRLEILRAISEYSARFVPAVKALNVIRVFTGLRPFCEDGSPIVSDVPGIGGLYIATGHEGDGIALAPVTGKTVADMVTGRETEFDMTPFAFSRFAEKDAAEGGRT